MIENKSLFDFKYEIRESAPAFQESMADLFNIVKKKDGSEVDLRKIVWESPEFKQFAEEAETEEEEVIKVRAKFEIRRGMKKTSKGVRTIFVLEREDFFANDTEGYPASSESLTIEDALSEFYSQKYLIEVLIKHDALFDQRYFWKKENGAWSKSWWLEDPTESYPLPGAPAADKES